ncbi:hypothetical protein [Agrococcus jejuensis]|uniref:Transcriptional regulator, AbiEi antitoxin, Type IV TA system n=1 Tax=Agrococcus jejuensis TaxID=399736 RepID=A0A1G8BHR9_9MICO|nr:hypothetical protein [Agrococcus jejuensis]SDH32614.1 hypothetical protein SAMN04489720_0946 [Agrococcus jejuensis]
MPDPLDIVQTSQAKALGLVPSRSRALRQIRRGSYVDATAQDSAGVEDRYRARVRAVGIARPRIVFALESAAMLHGLPFGTEPRYVFSTGDPSMSGGRAGVRNSHLPIRPEHVVEVDGLRCSSVAWTLADLGRRRIPSDGIPAMDAALATGVVTKPDIERALLHQSKQGRVRARWSIAFADARSESVGESRSRVAIALLGFPVPQLQVVVRTHLGEFRADFGWRRGERWLLGEFDGLMKYGSLAAAEGRTGVDALVSEKRREDAMRVASDVCRWTWDDVIRPERLERILRATGLPQQERVLPTGVRLLS